MNLRRPLITGNLNIRGGSSTADNYNKTWSTLKWVAIFAALGVLAWYGLAATPADTHWDVKPAQVGDHAYLLWYIDGSSTVRGITHDPDCPCQCPATPADPPQPDSATPPPTPMPSDIPSAVPRTVPASS